MDDRVTRIRESEKKSHIETYTKKKLYSSDSWLSKPIKTVCEVGKIFSNYERIRILDLGAGVGRNSIYLAEQFKDRECLIDCVDLLDVAIDKLNQNAVEHGVNGCINGIVKSIEDFSIEPEAYNLIMAVSALEHVDSKNSFIAKLEEIKQGIKSDGIVLLVLNSEVREINVDTYEELEPQFELNLPTDEIQELLDDAFVNWEVIKKCINAQEYDIPREKITSRLSSNVITYVVKK